MLMFMIFHSAPKTVVTRRVGTAEKGIRRPPVTGLAGDPRRRRAVHPVAGETEEGAPHQVCMTRVWSLCIQVRDLLNHPVS